MSAAIDRARVGVRQFNPLSLYPCPPFVNLAGDYASWQPTESAHTHCATDTIVQGCWCKIARDPSVAGWMVVRNGTKGAVSLAVTLVTSFLVGNITHRQWRFAPRPSAGNRLSALGLTTIRNCMQLSVSMKSKDLLEHRDFSHAP